MGAFGAALIARDRHEGDTVSSMLSLDEVENLHYNTKMTRCKGCENRCLLTINTFPGNRSFIVGNRCERGLGKERPEKDIPNLFEYKYHRIFDYEPLPREKAKRGTVGIPRVLNFYENYPFWHTFFTELKFHVILSPHSSRAIYELGIESIPSESECYPAKLVHGHIEWLISQNPDFIFYPCVPYERCEDYRSDNHYNCPIVTSYSENIKNNVDAITSGKVRFLNPFMSFESEKILGVRLREIFKAEFGIDDREVMRAVRKGWNEMAKTRDDMFLEGRKTLRYLEETGRRGIVLAGRPYHIDPEINHGLPQLINSYGMAVLTEDSISDISPADHPLITLDQWMYHSRLYNAANFVKTRDNLDLIQLNSFGCGLDAVTTDQVNDILRKSGKIYTCLKIDEVNNLGAAKIRIRSLIAALRIREKKGEPRKLKTSAYRKVSYTEKMKLDGYTIICPQMSPIHFDLIEASFRKENYNIVVSDATHEQSVDMGLKYVNNDACYPSLIVVGQIICPESTIQTVCRFLWARPGEAAGPQIT